MKRNKQRKKQIILSTTAIIAILGAIIALCNIIVDKNAKGRTFNDINDVPTMQTALLLGTNPKTRDGKDQVPSIWHVSKRLQNFTNMESSNNLLSVETSAKAMTNHKQCATTL